MAWADRLRGEKPLIGVVHLPPLPGSPRYGGDMGEVLERALSDAEAYYSAGITWIILENYGDHPYQVRAGPATVAGMAVAVREVRRALPDAVLGVNMLRNSGPEALAVAHAAGAQFVRVNALAEVMEAPEGLLEPVGREVAMLRRLLGAQELGVFADVKVKHASPLGSRSLEEVARDAVARGGADAVIVSGPRTGEPPSPEEVSRAYSCGAPVLIGSGVTVSNLRTFWKLADGFIVGTYLKKDGVTTNPVDPVRVKRLVEEYVKLRGE